MPISSQQPIADAVRRNPSENWKTHSQRRTLFAYKNVDNFPKFPNSNTNCSSHWFIRWIWFDWNWHVHSTIKTTLLSSLYCQIRSLKCTKFEEFIFAYHFGNSIELIRRTHLTFLIELNFRKNFVGWFRSEKKWYWYAKYRDLSQ